jgi:hypothetical protein
MGGGFRFILLQQLHHNLFIAVHSRPAKWGVATECVAAFCGKGGRNLGNCVGD